MFLKDVALFLKILTCLPLSERLMLITRVLLCSGGSRGGALHLFWVEKEEMTEGREANRASKSKPPPSPLVQSLDPPLLCPYEATVHSTLKATTSTSVLFLRGSLPLGV